MNTTREFQRLIEQALEKASNEVPSQITYWDDTTKHFGSKPYKIGIKINAQNALEDLFSDLSLGFGENYVNKNIEVTGNLKDLLYLENFINKNNIKVPAKTKLAIAVNKLSNINSKKGAKKISLTITIWVTISLVCFWIKAIRILALTLKLQMIV